jgi:hypothetical protein
MIFLLRSGYLKVRLFAGYSFPNTYAVLKCSVLVYPLPEMVPCTMKISRPFFDHLATIS